MKKALSLCLIFLIILSTIPFAFFTYATDDVNTKSELVTDISELPYYSRIKNEYEQKGHQHYTGEPIIYNAADIFKSEHNFKTNYTYEGNEYTGILWDEQQKSISFHISVPEKALYKIGVEYLAIPWNGGAIERKLYVDNGPVFKEASGIKLNRFWYYTEPSRVNEQGDEVKSFSSEQFNLSTTYFTDSQGKSDSPFQFLLESGEHVISLEYIAEPVFITKIILSGEEKLPTYSELSAEYKKTGKTAMGEKLEFEAESFKNIAYTSDSVLGMQNSGDPSVSPKSLYNIKMNYIGGWDFRKGNQEISWSFNVKKSGLYKIGLRVYRIWQDGLPCYRQIRIDGKIPCQEFESYSFPYSRNWYSETLSDKNGNACYIWLDAGEHSLTLTVKLGVYTKVIETLSDWSKEYSSMIRRIKLITGENPDSNFDYQLKKNVPGLIDSFEKLNEKLNYCTDILFDVAGKNTPVSNGIKSVYVQTEELIKKPELIARRLSDMETALGSIGNYITSLKDCPMGIDKIWVYGDDNEIPQYKASFWAKCGYSFVKFINSFTKDYNSVSAIKGTEQTKKDIKIWVGRGKEWAELIKQLSDADFTSETRIGTDISIIPASQVSATGLNSVILAVSAGTAPDIVLGMGTTLPVEYAMRNAVVDLTTFSDFKETALRFYNQSFVPLTYNKGVYGLPETVNFRATFYRSDIFCELNLTVPDTWQTLYDITLPRLYQKGLQCYIPMLYDVFLFQNGGKFYTEDLRHTGLDNPVAFKAFKQLCELYINYDIPVSVSFFNRFRTGEMPIGIGDFALYSTLVTAASELDGSWAMAPIPGVEDENGNINRSSSGFAIDSSIIVSTSQDKQAAWSFLKWWTGDEVQARFALLIESSLGVTARYNSANIKANIALGYTADQRKAIDVFYENAQESEVVPGGYYTSRYLNNAWNSVVVNGNPMRDAFEEAVEEIEIELKRRHEEFGITTD